MAFVLKDRVKETTTSTGTGNISLGGASATFDTFASVMSNADTTYYAIVHAGTGVDEWEVGLGTFNTGNTLSRTTVLSSSNSGSATNFSAGDKDVFMAYPADKAIFKDSNGKVDITPTSIDGTIIGGTNPAAANFTNVGASGEIDVGTHIDFAVQSAHASYTEGRLWYDNIHKTLNFYSDNQNVIHEIGLEEHQRVYNNSGATIGKGKPLYFAGNYTAGTIDVPTVGLADATDVNAYNAQGLAAADIPNNSYGYCIIAGQLDGLDTSALTAGANFFVGLTPGAVQNASPTYPNYPMCLGWVVNSDSTDGVLLVNQQNHSVNSFRVRTDAHIGDDLIVGGNLSVLGTTTTTSTSDVTAGAPFYRANEGDAIGDANTTFSGSGLDDAFFAGHFTGTTSTTYYVKIDSVGTPDTFSVSTDNFATTISTGTAITGSEQMIHSADNISVKFGATTGHTLNDTWTGTAGPVLVDTGFFSNRNTGTSGVGYTHMGLFYDVSTDKWTLLDEYDPTPSGAINLSHASVGYGTLKAGTFEGNVTGNITGAVSGNATTATTLATARNIAGNSFDGSADIDIDLTDLKNVNHIAVTVSASKFYLDGTQQQTAKLTPSVVYRFDQSDSSNSGHPLRISTTSDGTHNSGSALTTGVTEVGTPGSAGAYTQVILEQDSPEVLYYYCGNHSGMGGEVYTGRDLTALTSTVTELNLVDGSTAGTVVNSKAVVYGASGEVNATTLQVGGVAITSTPAELNKLDGATASTAELNILTGVTADATEINKLDGAAGGTIANDKAVIYGSAGEVNATTLQIGGTSITATAAELNFVDGVTSNIQTQLDDNVTTATTVQAAGALMDSELTSEASVKAINQGLTTTSSPTFAGITLTDGIQASHTSLTASGSTLTIDLSASNHFIVTMTANTTFAFSNKDAGRFGNIIIQEDSTGGYSFTLPSECKTPLNGASITQQTGANKVSILSYHVLDSSNILMNYIGDFA